MMKRILVVDDEIGALTLIGIMLERGGFEVLKAKDAGLNVTVHSGENTPAFAVVETINAVHPDRIGHGIHSIEDLKAVELVKEQNITLEVNPWSNYLTNSVRSIEDHPLNNPSTQCALTRHS